MTLSSDTCFIFQSLVMHDKTPVKYITYNGKSKGNLDDDDCYEHDSDDYDY